MRPQTPDALVETLLAGEDPAPQPTDTKSDFEKMRKAAIEYFKEGQWPQRDIRKLALAPTPQDLRDVMWGFASRTARRKGYGADGAASIASQDEDAIEARAGLSTYLEDNFG